MFLNQLLAKSKLVAILFISITSTTSSAQTLIDEFMDGPFSLQHDGSFNGTVSSQSPLSSSVFNTSPGAFRSWEMRNFNQNSAITADLDVTVPGTLDVGSSIGSSALGQLFYGHSGGRIGLSTTPYANQDILITATTAINSAVDLEASITFYAPFLNGTTNVFTQQRKWFAGKGVCLSWSDFILTQQSVGNGSFVDVTNGPSFDPTNNNPLFSAIGEFIVNFAFGSGDAFELDRLEIGTPPTGFCPAAPVNPSVVPGPNGGNIFRFENVQRQLWHDPPMAFGYDYIMTSESLFDKIAMEESVVDAEVYVDEILLGTFQGGELIRFADFASSLGSSLIFNPDTGGLGVEGFRIAGIETDASDTLAFPLYVDADTELLSYDQIPLVVPEPTCWFGFCGIAVFVLASARNCQKPA